MPHAFTLQTRRDNAGSLTSKTLKRQSMCSLQTRGCMLWSASITCHLFALAIRLADQTRKAVFLTQIALLRELPLLPPMHSSSVSAWQSPRPLSSASPSPFSVSLSFLAFSFKWRHMTLCFAAKLTSLCRPGATGALCFLFCRALLHSINTAIKL